MLNLCKQYKKPFTPDQKELLFKKRDIHFRVVKQLVLDGLLTQDPDISRALYILWILRSAVPEASFIGALEDIIAVKDSCAIRSGIVILLLNLKLLSQSRIADGLLDRLVSSGIDDDIAAMIENSGAGWRWKEAKVTDT